MSDNYSKLSTCYRSGQMTEKQWQGHLSAAPLLRLWYERKILKQGHKA